MIKNFVIGIISGIFVFSIFYLLGAFMQISFDISKWSEDARVLVGIFGGFFGILTIVIIVLNKQIERIEL